MSVASFHRKNLQSSSGINGMGPCFGEFSVLTDKIFPCQNSKRTTRADTENYSEFLDAVASLASGHDYHSLIKVHNKTQGFRVKLRK